MTVIEVPALDDDRAWVLVRVPVKGRKPLEFKVPRRDMTPYEDIKVIQWLSTELDYDRSKLAALVDPDAPNAVDRAVLLLAFRPYVSDAQFKVLRTLEIGQLNYINRHLNKLSMIPMGESLASSDS